MSSSWHCATIPTERHVIDAAPERSRVEDEAPIVVTIDMPEHECFPSEFVSDPVESVSIASEHASVSSESLTFVAEQRDEQSGSEQSHRTRLSQRSGQPQPRAMTLAAAGVSAAAGLIRRAASRVPSLAWPPRISWPSAMTRRPEVAWRLTSTQAAAVAALVLLLVLWPHDRRVPTFDRHRPWTMLAAPLDPQVVTADPSAAQAIRRTLNVYRDAMGILDVDAVKGVWPAVDELVLRDRFAAVYDQNLDYYSCDIVVMSISATAVCTGRLTIAGNVRPRRRSTQAREWYFKLRQQPSGWAITRVAAADRGGVAAAAMY